MTKRVITKMLSLLIAVAMLLALLPAGLITVSAATAESGTLTLTRTDSTADIHGSNILHGSGSAVAVTDGKVPIPGSSPAASGTPYVLGVSGSALGFHQFTGKSIPANKAYYVE